MKTLRYLTILIVLLTSACNFSLAEDIAPPPGYTSDQLLSEKVIEYPENPPSPQRGGELYYRDCIACHGETGLGNGPMASSMPVAVTAIGLGLIRNQVSPSGWFEAITLGNPERGMPAYPSYSTQDSWDLLSFLFTMEATADVFREGEELYLANCAECHGIAGDVVPGTEFNDLEAMAQVTNAGLYRSISEGKGTMLPFAGKLTDPEIWKIVDYLRSKAYDMSGSEVSATVEPTPTGTVPSEAVPSLESTLSLEPTLTESLGTDSGAIKGTVIHDSGTMIASDLLASLIIYDHTAGQIVDSQTTPIMGDGSFVFTEIPLDPQITYWVSVDYQGVTYFSDAVAFDGSSDISGISISIYESTTDWTTLYFDLVHISLAVVDDAMQVSELLMIKNPGRTTITIETDGSALPFIKLPQGVAEFTSLSPDQSSAPFLPAAGGIALPPSPDLEYGIVATFSIPYQRDMDFSQEFKLLIKSLTLFTPEGLRIKTDQLVDSGVEDFGGTSFHLYEGTNLTPGTLDLSISGRPKTAEGKIETRTLVIYAAGLLGLIFIGLGIYMFLRDRRLSKIETIEIEDDHVTEPISESIDGILDSILVLDDKYENGEISTDDYRKRRKELMRKVKKSADQ